MAIKYTPFYLVGFLSGVMLRSFIDFPTDIVLGLFVATLSFCIFIHIFHIFVFSAQNKTSIILGFFIFFLFGFVRLSLFNENIHTDQLHNFYNQETFLEGTVLKAEQKPNSQRVVIDTNFGKTLLVTNTYPQYKYGDIISILGTIKEPEMYGKYDAKKILASENIYSEIIFPEIKKIEIAPPNKILYYLFTLRAVFEKNIRLILPEPHASLANGMLLGDGSGLDKKVTEAFLKSGTIHILVLSGYNITIVGVFVMSLLAFIFPLSVAWFGSIFGILVFTAMTGAQAPAVRSAIMAIIGLIALRGGRKNFAGFALLWAAFLMVLWNPMTLRWDRGFQLSFLATLGLIVASPIIKKKLYFLPIMLGIRESGASTLSAQLFVLPLLLSWGSEISIFSPIANILIVGVVPFIMFFSFFGGIFALASVTAGKIIASVSYALISFQVYVANMISAFPMSSIVLHGMPMALLILVYAYIFYWSWKYYFLQQNDA